MNDLMVSHFLYYFSRAARPRARLTRASASSGRASTELHERLVFADMGRCATGLHDRLHKIDVIQAVGRGADGPVPTLWQTQT